MSWVSFKWKFAFKSPSTGYCCSVIPDIISLSVPGQPSSETLTASICPPQFPAHDSNVCHNTRGCGWRQSRNPLWVPGQVKYYCQYFLVSFVITPSIFTRILLHHFPASSTIKAGLSPGSVAKALTEPCKHLPQAVPGFQLWVEQKKLSMCHVVSVTVFILKM